MSQSWLILFACLVGILQSANAGEMNGSGESMDGKGRTNRPITNPIIRLLEERLEKLEQQSMIRQKARNCNDYKKAGATQNGLYEIDPDGMSGVQPLMVQCDFTGLLGRTIVRLVSPSNTVVEQCEGADCFSQRFEYAASERQIKALTLVSTSCTQKMKFGCFVQPINGLATLVGTNHQQSKDTGCECHKTKSCLGHPKPNTKCHCDIQPTVLRWLKDEVVLDEKEFIPLMEFRLGPVRGHANFTISDLECHGGEPLPDTLRLEERIGLVEKTLTKTYTTFKTGKYCYDNKVTGGLGKKSGIPTLASCHHMCSRTPGCRFVSYNVDAKTWCFMDATCKSTGSNAAYVINKLSLE